MGIIKKIVIGALASIVWVTILILACIFSALPIVIGLAAFIYLLELLT